MIRNAETDDASRLAEIHICGWRYAYRGIISDYELFTQRQISKSIESMKRKITEGSQILVFEDENDKIIKGFCWHGKSRDEDIPNSYEIYAIYIQPEFVRMNIGTSLVNEISVIMEKEKMNKLIIWVLEKNNKGIEFYNKNGFKNDGKKKYIEEWKEFEIRMEKDS